MSKYVGRIITDQAPAGYSVFFDGSGDYLTGPTNNAAFQFGTGDFTVEMWINTANLAAYQTLLDTRSADTQSAWCLFLDNTGKPYWYDASGVQLSSTAVVANTWTHLAVSRSGSTLRMFLSGVQVFSGSNSNSQNPTGTFYVARNAVNAFLYTGYISNLRIIKGTALYTAAFTPPTQLLNITNTSLLTCNSPAIVDQSSNAFAITTNGNAAVSTFTPFAAYNPAPTSSNPLTPAPGVWTLDEALQYTQQGVWPSPITNAIEDVFSTYLYTGNGSTQTITNGINLATYGGLVWNKVRNSGTTYHYWVDTARGRSSGIGSNSTDAQYISSAGNDLASFTTTGYTLGPVQNWNASNSNGGTIVSWAFRKQAKFFDVVTYTGNGANRTIAHNLGSVPGCIIVKRTSSAKDWAVYHRGIGNTKYLTLNSTAAAATVSTYWNNTDPTSTVFTVGTDGDVNTNGETYVAYLFAHDAGGFGPAGTDNVISCGTFAATSGTFVNLGWEPQWLLIKNAASANSWGVADNMRGVVTGGNDQYLLANSTDAEASAELYEFNATGFTIRFTASNDNYIYIAIRRGPMRPPITSTSVFKPSNTAGVNTTPFVVDFNLGALQAGASYSPYIYDRLRGSTQYLITSSTNAETTGASVGFDTNSGVTYSWPAGWFNYFFGRAPGFFDVVCYTGNGSARTINHNLTIPPEFIIVKKRSAAGDYWQVYHIGIGNSNRIFLNSNDAASAASSWNNTTPTASVFSLGTSGAVNASGATFVAYLFATVGGVSKVGSYAGTGTTQQINCGFTSGSRFVLIKRIDSTGDWYVWDSARGIVAGNDPYFLLNSTAAEVTNTDYVDTYSLGFELSSTAPAALNASGGTYIFLAIA